MQTVIDYGPDTPKERWAKEQLAELQRRYQQEAEPFIKILTDEQAMKVPRYVMQVPELGETHSGSHRR